MAPLENGQTNGLNGDAVPSSSLLNNLRFSDIPDAIDIPASSFDSEVEVLSLIHISEPTRQIK